MTPARRGTWPTLDLIAQPDGSFRLDLDRLDTMLRWRPRLHPQFAEQPHRLDRHARGIAGHPGHRPPPRRLADLRRGLFPPHLRQFASRAPSLLDVAEPDDQVIVCNSFSKTWMMTGWRLGWLVLPEGTRDAVTEIVEVLHSGVAPFIQQAGIAAIHDIRGGGTLPCPLRCRTGDGRPGARWCQRRALRRAPWCVLCVRGRRRD